MISTCFLLTVCCLITTSSQIDDPYFRKDYAPPPTQGNMFAAISHMQPLAKIERSFVNKAKEYIAEEKEKLKEMKKFANEVKESMKISKGNEVHYLGNPINSYLIIKRFTNGWKELLNKLDPNNGSKPLADLKQLGVDYGEDLPEYGRDLTGAIGGLIRLMDTYGFTAKEITEGDIKGIRRSSYQLSALDLLEIVRTAHDTSQYHRMMEFLWEADRIMSDDHLRSTRSGGLSIKTFHEYGAMCEYLNGDMHKALYHTREVLKLVPNSSQANQNLKIYKWYVDNNQKCERPECSFVKTSYDLLDKNSVYTRYRSACRKTVDQSTKLKNLRKHSSRVCFYKQDRPRLILKPVKVTRLHDNPEAFIFHNIISQEDMEKVIEIATLEIAPAQVIDGETNEIKTADYRVAKSMWMQGNDLEEEKREISKKLDVMAKEVTNLNPEYAESYQVQNYGLGGQYEFHVDHGDPGSYLESHKHGNRIATLLYYLSDVERGGHTVFTQLGIAAYANKGDALMWHNLYKNGTGNSFTEHAGCPVISGSKWVMNKWFKLKSGETSRLCSIDQLV